MASEHVLRSEAAWCIAPGVGCLAWFTELRFPAANVATLAGYVSTALGLYLMGLLVVDRGAIAKMRELVAGQS
jgi:hypothetical protein